MPGAQQNQTESIANYMRRCLKAYYGAGDPFGKEGDFTTAPEVSQMFGEILGAWAAHNASYFDTPIIVEIGPGRGTLMADALRAVPLLKKFDIHLIETSDSLTTIQKEILRGQDVNWLKSIEDLPRRPAIFIANELFDALPISQYRYKNGSWHEIRITKEQTFIDSPAADLALPESYPAPREGDIVELSADQDALMRLLAGHIKSCGGMAAIIDYGHLNSGYGDTLQALRNHAYSHVLDNPGQSDLTSHVDFRRLKDIAIEEGCALQVMTTQKQFLTGLGIIERAKLLRRNQAPSIVEKIDSELHRLIDENEMGHLFKVLVISS